jgi:DNA-binding transcriptional LysR family regulator
VKLMGEAMTGVWESLLDGRADIILAVGQGPSGGGFRTKKVAELQFVFCVSPQHPLAAWDGVIPSDELRKHRMIVASDSARHLPARTVGLLRGQPIVAVPDIRTKYALQVAGLGVGFLPHLFVKSALQRGLLVEKQAEEPKPDDQMFLAWRTNEPGRALKWWRDALSDTDVVPNFLKRASQAWVADY